MTNKEKNYVCRKLSYYKKKFIFFKYKLTSPGTEWRNAVLFHVSRIIKSLLTTKWTFNILTGYLPEIKINNDKKQIVRLKIFISEKKIKSYI